MSNNILGLKKYLPGSQAPPAFGPPSPPPARSSMPTVSRELSRIAEGSKDSHISVQVLPAATPELTAPLAPVVRVLPLPMTAAIIESEKKGHELYEIAIKTEGRIKQMEEEIRRYETDLKAKVEGAGDVLQIGREMAELENAIKVLQCRLAPLKRQHDQERASAAKCSITVGTVRCAVREYLDVCVAVRIAALYALCDGWKSAFVIDDHVAAIAYDSEDFAPYLRWLESLCGMKHVDDARSLTEEQLALLLKPLPALGEWKLNVGAERSVPQTHGRFRDVKKAVTEEDLKQHARRCVYRPTTTPSVTP